MFYYPKAYFDSVKDISIEFLKQNNIEALILDVDNTILDFDKKFPDGVCDWVKNLKEQGIKFYILSNSNHKEKVKMVSETLDIPYFYFATKPLKRGFKKVLKELNIENKKVAAVGDQIFTDVIGSNRCKIFSILVKPLGKKDIFITKIKRPIENYVIRKYEKNMEKNRKNNK